MNYASKSKNASGKIVAPNEDYAGTVRLGLWVLIVGFGGFLAWAVLAPLDEGVPAQAVVASESNRKQVNHPTGGVIKEILVREGSRVKQGERLLLFDDVQALSAVKTALNQWHIAIATAARLEAERKGLPEVVFPSELLNIKNDPKIAALIKSQTQLFFTRRASLEGEIALLRELIHGLELQIASLDQLKSGRSQQVALLQERLRKYQTLNDRGVVSRIQLIGIESQLAEVYVDESSDLSRIVELEARVEELRMRLRQLEIVYRAEVEAAFADAQRETSESEERLVVLRDVYDRMIVRSPVDGVIVDLSFHTIGSSISAGERMLDIVPEGDRLIIEAKVDPQYIDRIYPGLTANVHFDAYTSGAGRPTTTGIVEVVSADALIDSRGNNPYYAVRVSVSAEEMEKLGALVLQPGMTCTVMVKTGERSLLVYLTRPLLRFLGTAMKEH